MGALVLAAAAVARGLVPRFALIGGAREIGSLAGSAMAPKEAENVKQLRLKTGSVTRCARSLAPQRQRLPAASQLDDRRLDGCLRHLRRQARRRRRHPSSSRTPSS